MTKPKKEIKPGIAWCWLFDFGDHFQVNHHASGKRIYDIVSRTGKRSGLPGNVKHIRVALVPIKDYRRLLADAKAYQKLKKPT